MATELAAPAITPEEFLKLPDGNLYELVDGRLLETNMSLESSWIASQLIMRLETFVAERSLGSVFTSEATYRCFGDDPGKVRRPRVSFMARGRLSAEQFAEGHCTIPPDLVVEVISPNDVAYDVEEKAQEYLASGVRLVWVINPRSRTVTAHLPDCDPQLFGPHARLTGDPVLPGFAVAVSDLFPEKTAVL